jgi:hypothetical protein
MRIFENLLSNRLETISDTFKSNLYRIFLGMNPLKILFLSNDNDKYPSTLQFSLLDTYLLLYLIQKFFLMILESLQ